MKNNQSIGKTAAFALAAIFVLSGCSSERTDEYTFANAGFERGTLDGWTVEGNAFSDRCVYIQSKDEQGNAFYKKGEFFLYGGKEDGTFRGTLTSEPFRLEGNGKIGFLKSATSRCAIRKGMSSSGGEMTLTASPDFMTACIGL